MTSEVVPKPGTGAAFDDGHERSRGRKKAEDFIESALRICDREGAAAVTARRIARDMNLSPMALYRHFRSMEHLMAIVWNEGFARMLGRMEEEFVAAGGLEGFRRQLAAYVAFGVQHPGLYFFMFSPGPRPEDYGTENLGLAAMRRLNQRIKGLQKAGLVPCNGDPEAAALNAWFALHGLTTVAITGQVSKVTELELDELIRDTIDRILHAL